MTESRARIAALGAMPSKAPQTEDSGQAVPEMPILHGSQPCPRATPHGTRAQGALPLGKSLARGLFFIINDRNEGRTAAKCIPTPDLSPKFADLAPEAISDHFDLQQIPGRCRCAKFTFLHAG